MGELGLLGVDVPEKYGGSAMSKTGMCILAEGIAKGGNSSLLLFGVFILLLEV
ncbi:MAG: hypothetical protein Ct9H300mP18_04010 [Candidatus Neomarinimicrobiota bacterium]|nr:MAG: hypothetical protein Ct9H300mP18_04010 [Candidatus Neomarinimicrobiota bacterium]